jgi:hypothetical protein
VILRQLLSALAAALPALAGPVPAKRIDGNKGIWFELGQKSQHGDKYSGGLGTYTANHAPMAVYSVEADKTFFVYGGTPAKDQRRLLAMVSYYDHKTRQVPRPAVVMDKSPVNDPHDNPALHIDRQGYLWVFVSGRGRTRPGVIYRSGAPYSIESFERIEQAEITYPQIWPDKDGGSMLLFTKYTAGRELYWKTAGADRAWGADQKLAGFGGHYQTSFHAGGKTATFFNYHPGGNVDRRTNLYYAQTTDSGKTWTTAGGGLLSLPLDRVHNPALVLDLQSQGRLMYTCDLNFDPRGNPILLYVTSGDARPGPAGDPRHWQVTRWTGAAWDTDVLAPAPHNYAMGSLWVTDADWRIIAPTEAGPQAPGAGGEIALWISRDQGESWSKDRQITSGSPFNHNYVRRPLLAKDPFFAFWADGNPNQPSESRLFFCDSTGTRIHQLPYQMGGDSALMD